LSTPFEREWVQVRTKGIIAEKKTNVRSSAGAEKGIEEMA
jgi:hypothetical protein